MFFEKYSHHLLLLLILISKECLILNEEILVLFSFIVFCRLVVTNISQLIVVELKIRTKKMKESYNLLKQLRNELLVRHKEYNEKQARFSLFLIKSLIIIKKEAFFMMNEYKNTLKNKIILSGVAYFSYVTASSIDSIKYQISLLEDLYNIF
jgi:hypothetical protein